MKPDKPKWTAAITKIIHEDPVEVASLHESDSEDQFYTNIEIRIAKIGKYYLLCTFDEQWENDYKWVDSIDEVKKAISELMDGESDDEKFSAWQNPDLLNSLKDSAHLFGEEWDPDDIVKEIEADENFRERILIWDTLPDEYEY